MDKVFWGWCLVSFGLGGLATVLGWSWTYFRCLKSLEGERSNYRDKLATLDASLARSLHHEATLEDEIQGLKIAAKRTGEDNAAGRKQERERLLGMVQRLRIELLNWNTLRELLSALDNPAHHEMAERARFPE